MEKIEKLIIEYQQNTSDHLFVEIYEKLRKQYLKGARYSESIRLSIGGTDHDVLEIFDNCVMYTVSNYKIGQPFEAFFKWKFRNMRANFIRNKTTRESFEELTLNSMKKNIDEEYLEMLTDSTTTEDIVLKTKEAEQLQLLDFLVRGENVRTTAIVQAYLNHPKPNATAIAKEIGLDHKQVSRALTRLAAKYCTKQFGSHRDYLVAL